MYFFLFFLNLTTQSGFYMTAPCTGGGTATECMGAPPLDAGTIGTADHPLMVKAVGPRTLPNSIEFGTVNIVLASGEGHAETVARSWPVTPFDVAIRTVVYRATPVKFTGCYEQSMQNGGLSRPLRGDPVPIDSRQICANG